MDIQPHIVSVAKTLTVTLAVITSLRTLASYGEPLPLSQNPKGVCKISFEKKLPAPISINGKVVTKAKGTCSAFYIGNDFFASSRHCFFTYEILPLLETSTHNIPEDAKLECDNQNLQINFDSIQVADRVSEFLNRNEIKILNDLVIFNSKVAVPEAVPSLTILKRFSDLPLETQKDEMSGQLVYVFSTPFSAFVFGYGINENSKINKKLHGSMVNGNLIFFPSYGQFRGTDWGYIKDSGTLTSGDSGGPLMLAAQNSGNVVIGINTAHANLARGSYSTYSLLTWEILKSRFQNGSRGLIELIEEHLK